MSLDNVLKDLDLGATRLTDSNSSHRSDRLLEKATLLERVSVELHESFCGSWIGYHSSVYYEHFMSPPPGHHFCSKWGGLTHKNNRTKGIWIEYEPSEVEAMLYAKANIRNSQDFARSCVQLLLVIERGKHDLMAILMSFKEQDIPFLAARYDAVCSIDVTSPNDWINQQIPNVEIVSYDNEALKCGNKIPPHIRARSLSSTYIRLRKSFNELQSLFSTIKSYIMTNSNSQKTAKVKDPRIFIGHGRSPVWKELRDFLRDRVGHAWEEYNRVPTAGMSTISRLEEMIDASVFAFLVMTPEDEQKDGHLRARENVIHEAGLFQGRLGFSKAIILREEGCEQFSNVLGLGEIHFQKNNIKSIFEDIRQVLEREAIV